MGIFKRRKGCNPDYQTYDEQVMEYVVKKVGCSPPYYSTTFNVPTCTSPKKLRAFATSIHLSKNHGLPPPCKSLEFMTFKYDEIDYKGTAYDSGGNFWVSLVVPNLIFKEFSQTKAIDWQALIGNVGGYVGLVFGTSFISPLPYIQKRQNGFSPKSLKLIYTP